MVNMKKLISTFAILLFTVVTCLAQNPTTTNPLVGTNSRWTNGLAPGYWPTKGSGLTLNVSSGTAFCASTIVTYAGATLTMTDNTTNYVYLDTTLSCAPSSNTTGFGSTTIPLAVVVTSGGAITSIADDRTMFFAGGAGGTGLASLNGLTASSQTFATGTTGTDFNISSVGSVHTFNFPDASATNRGLLTSANWTLFNGKASISGTPVAGDCVSWLNATTVQDSGVVGCGSGGTAGVFASYQVGTNTPITGAGKYFQLAAGTNISFGYSGSGTSGSPFIATINSTGGGGGSTLTIANDGTTGTVLNKLAKLTGAPSTVRTPLTTDTGGIVGIVSGGAGTTSNATIQISGQVGCVFDGATTANDYVEISSTTAGDCHDGGSTYPLSGQVLGRVLSTNASGGTYQVDLFPAEIQAVGGVNPVNLGISAGTQAGNSCSAPANLTMTGLTTQMVLAISYTSDPAALTGWGSTGGMKLAAWPSSADTAQYEVCNQTASSISYSGITFIVTAVSGGGGGSGGGTVTVNSTSVSSPNFNDSTPAASAGNVNIKWQTSGSNVSGYVPSLTLKTNGVNNGSQTQLNLAAGTNVTLTDNGTGTVTIASSGGGGGGGTGYAGVNAQTGTTYTTVIGDAGFLITMNNSSANTATIPTNASVAYTVGTVITFTQLGAGQTSIAAAGGVTINTPTSLSARAQYSTIFVEKIATDTWVAGGDLQ